MEYGCSTQHLLQSEVAEEHGTRTTGCCATRDELASRNLAPAAVDPCTVLQLMHDGIRR